MTSTLIHMYRGQPGVAATLLHTVAALSTDRILSCVACNDTTTAVTFTMYLVPSGGSAGVTNMIVNAKTLASGESLVVSEAIGHVLAAGAMIYALASSADQVTLTITGQRLQ